MTSLSSILIPSSIDAVINDVVGNTSTIQAGSSRRVSLLEAALIDMYTSAETDTAIGNAIDIVLASAPGALDTLNELALALGNDPDFATTVTNSIATKLAKAGGAMTGDIDMGDNKVTNATLENYQEIMAADADLPASVTIADTGNTARYTLTGNATINLPTTDDMPASSSRAVTVIVKQDATGGRSLTLSPPAGYTILWNNAVSQPAVNPTANKTTIYTATYIKGDTNIYVSLSFYEG